MAVLRNRTTLNRHGVALIYAAVLIVVLMSFIGLAVDVGRAQYTKSQLQVLADVSARAAAAGISDNTTLAKANAVANYNAPDGGAITFSAGDVVTGNWNSETKTFTAGGTPANAVRVTAARTTARGNALPMHFLQLLGNDTADIAASAIATGAATMAQPYGAVGITRVRLLSNAYTDSYDSSIGNYSSSWTPDKGNVASNGTITLGRVRGDARQGVGLGPVTGGNVTGSRAALTTPLSYPDPTSNSYSYAVNDNANLPAARRPGQNFSGGSCTMPAGNYYFNNFTLSGTLTVTGPATVYVAGRLSFDGDARTSVHRPQNLRFVVLGTGDVDMDSNPIVYADIYAPRSDVVLNSNSVLHGRVIGGTLTMDSNAVVHVDEALVNGSGGSDGGVTPVQVVQ